MKKLKFIAVIGAIAFLSGCEWNSLGKVRVYDKSIVPTTIMAICLDGVQYYHYDKGIKAGLSVSYDKETLKPKLCD